MTSRQHVGSAVGCGPFATCYNFPELLRRWRAPGEGLERREFSPGIPEVISKTLKDTPPLADLQQIRHAEKSPPSLAATSGIVHVNLIFAVLIGSLHCQ